MMQDIDSGRQTYRGAADRQTGIHRAGQIETDTERHTQSRTDRDREAYTEQDRYRQKDGHT